MKRIWCRLWGHGGMTVVDTEEPRVMPDSVARLLTRMAEYGQVPSVTEWLRVVSCARCGVELGRAREGETFYPEGAVERPHPARWEIWLGETRAEYPEICTLGPLRCVVEYLRCHLFGHVTEWNRNIFLRGWDEECRNCGQSFRHVSDRRDREWATMIAEHNEAVRRATAN